MLLKRLLMIVCISLFAIACRDKALADTNSSLPKDFTLQAGEKVLVNDVEFEFERVKQDSRCPKGTQCIHQGAVDVVVNYTINNTPVQKVLSLGAKNSNDILVVQDMVFQLGYLKPYPAANIKIDPASYNAHFITFQSGDFERATVVDVRTQKEFDAGHFNDAEHIPYDEISDRASELSLEKDDLIVVYCRSGNRAGKAKVSLETLGYTNVINAVDQSVVTDLMTND